jgi:tetrahydromethanopterin S-methyltransferase subunit F
VSGTVPGIEQRSFTMYGNDDYVAGVTYGRPSSRRKWLAVGMVLAAVVMVLVLVILAFQAGEDELDVPVGAASSPTATPSATASAEPTAEPTDGSAGTGGAANTGSGGGGGGSGDSGGTGDTEDTGDGGDTEEPEPPAEPLNIEATIDTVTPGGQCFASGTIAVSGGEYPLTVHYQWRALVIAGGLDGEPVSAVHNVTFTEPGEAGIQTSALPEDGTNVFLVVTGPEPAGSGLVTYDGCSDGPGEIVGPGD